MLFLMLRPVSSFAQISLRASNRRQTRASCPLSRDSVARGRPASPEAVRASAYGPCVTEISNSRLQVDPVDQTAQPRIGRSDFFVGPGVLFLASGDLI